MKTYRLTTMLVIFILVLSACNMPSSQAPEPTTNPNAVFTAAAQTVVAQLTQNALLIPTNPPTATIAAPTSTTAPAVINTLPAPPVSTATSVPAAVPTSSCDAAQFISDVSIPDGTVFSGSATFVKTWRLKNIGTCTWNSYTLFFVSGDAMAGPTSQAITGTVAPGASVDISINLQAPAADGTYRGYWGIKNPSGQQLNIVGGSSNRSFYVEIKVGSGGGTPSTPSTPGTPGPVGEFAVTSVTFGSVDKSACGSLKYTITATVTANKAGEVTYTWILSNGTTGDSDAITFDKAGTQTISYTATFAADVTWVELYIDKPNHQQFGRAKLVCP